MKSAVVLLTSFMAILAACAPASSPSDSGGAPQAPPRRTLVMIARAELPSLAVKPLVGYSGSLNPPLRLFNATLDFVDEKEVPRPYLQEALPQLNTETWRVFPDGQMETIHRLRPNLTWHDGTLASADDFVFAWRVYSTPALGVSNTKPMAQIAEVTAPDPRTVVIRWRQPFPDAASMDTSFQALPGHLLEQPFQTLDAAAFANHSFWTVEYVGLGPYRLDSWEPGAYSEFAAFDGHVLGRPKIDRIRMVYIADPSTALANLLSGEAHFVLDFVLGYEEGLTLDREWAVRNGGTVFFAPVLIRQSQIQQRPDYAKPKALLDLRVRRALGYAFDTPGALEVFTGGRGVITHTLTSPRAEYYSQIERAITKRDYDPRTAQRMLEEAGMTRSPDGFYVSAIGEPLRLDVWNTGGAVFERENRIFADSLRQAGIDATPQTMGPALLTDVEFRALAPGIFTGGSGNQRLGEYSTTVIPRLENRWQGNNRGGWENAEFERFWQAYNRTLDASERIKQIAEMERVFNEDVGAIPHYFTVVVTAHVAALQGPVARMTPDAPLGTFYTHLWEWRS